VLAGAGAGGRGGGKRLARAMAHVLAHVEAHVDPAQWWCATHVWCFSKASTPECVRTVRTVQVHKSILQLLWPGK